MEGFSFVFAAWLIFGVLIAIDPSPLIDLQEKMFRLSGMPDDLVNRLKVVGTSRFSGLVIALIGAAGLAVVWICSA